MNLVIHRGWEYRGRSRQAGLVSGGKAEVMPSVFDEFCMMCL